MLALLVVAAAFFGASDAQDCTNISSDYSCETHNVTTSDGYILQLHHNYHRANHTRNGKVVFLMHGYPFGYTSFTYMGPKNAIAYNLVEAGYDVWLGNARGTNFFLHHQYIDPVKDSVKFFDFTYEQIGLYDLSAMVDYVLATTKKQNLHFVGLSHGATAFMVLNSLNTTYNCKFSSAHLLAAVGYEKHYNNNEINRMASATDVLYNALLMAEYVDLKPVGFTKVYTEMLVNSTVPQELIGGTSVKQSVHFSQNIRDKAFRRFDMGSSAGNQAIYGSDTAPWYDLSVINVNVTLYYSVNDVTISEEDTLAMAQAMPKATVHKVAANFKNMDYITNPNVKNLVTKNIIRSLDQF